MTTPAGVDLEDARLMRMADEAQRLGKGPELARGLLGGEEVVPPAGVGRCGVDHPEGAVLDVDEGQAAQIVDVRLAEGPGGPHHRAARIGIEVAYVGEAGHPVVVIAGDGDVGEVAAAPSMHSAGDAP